jgi:HAD superfamily hydrolase (TIGR01509 family)
MKKGSSVITTVIFDLGEVYLQGFKGVNKRLAPILNLDPEAVRSALRGDENLTALFLGEISENEYWSRVIKRTGWNISVEKMEAIMRENFVGLEGTREIIEELKAQEYKLGLLSIHSKEWVEYCDRKFDYHKLFHSVLYSYEVHALKPEKRVYEMILERLGSSAGESLFIDNVEINLVPARELGMQTILFTDSKALKADLASLGITV